MGKEIANIPLKKCKIWHFFPCIFVMWIVYSLHALLDLHQNSWVQHTNIVVPIVCRIPKSRLIGSIKMACMVYTLDEVEPSNSVNMVSNKCRPILKFF